MAYTLATPKLSYNDSTVTYNITHDLPSLSTLNRPHSSRVCFATGHLFTDSVLKKNRRNPTKLSLRLAIHGDG